MRLRTRSAREGTQVHSADLDDALCTSGALASSGAGGETLLPFAVDDARLRGATRRAVGGACCGCHRKCPLFVRPAPALTIRACLCSQAVARQGAAAVSVRLGGVDGQSRVQLDGFKSRALRSEAPAQRHLYATEWRVLAAMPAPAQGRPAALVLGDAALPFEDERVPSQTRWSKLAVEASGGAGAAITMAVAPQCARLAGLPLCALEAALALVQAQASTASMPDVRLLMVGKCAYAGAWGIGRLSPLVC